MFQAAIYLHEEEAKYPAKIMYHVSPPHLSLEALEVSREFTASFCFKRFKIDEAKVGVWVWVWV